MIVNRHRQCALGRILANAMQIKVLLDFRWFGDFQLDRALASIGPEFLVEDIFAHDDATVTDINTGALDELPDLGM